MAQLFSLGILRMKRVIQITVSLAMLICGLLVSSYHAGQFSVWSACDTRYKAHISQLDKDGVLMLYFHDKGQDDYYVTNILTFKPSGRLYSGSNDSAVPMVGGGALALFGLAGLLDTFRRKKNDGTQH